MFSIVAREPSRSSPRAAAAYRGKLGCMRDGFLLDPRIAYFNHGGYGACPVEVFAEYQRLQRELESDPTSFFVRQFEIRLW